MKLKSQSANMMTCSTPRTLKEKVSDARKPADAQKDQPVAPLETETTHLEKKI